MAIAAPDPVEAAIGVAFEIGELGEVTYRLPDELPRQAQRFYAPLDISELVFCEDAYPTVSHPLCGVFQNRSIHGDKKG